MKYCKISSKGHTYIVNIHNDSRLIIEVKIKVAGSDGGMSAFGSAGPGFNSRWGSKFSTSGLGGVEMYTF